MNKIIKRIVSAVTAVAVTLTAVFVFDVPEKIVAEAATTDNCDGVHTGMTAWADSTKLPTASGNYYLTTDVTLGNRTEIPAGADITLCLNGHNVTQKSRAITISGNLTLCDCKGSGMITGCNNVPNSIRIESSGTFTMNGGKISGHTNISEGTVMAYGGTFVMNGGEISNNSGGRCGVYLFYPHIEAKFTMNGGKITGNTATGSGGGVYIYGDCTFIMNGGEISGNKAGYGGGVDASDSDCTFTMSGGKITGNSATSKAGGLYIGEQNVTLDGKVEISGNKVGDTNNNIESNFSGSNYTIAFFKLHPIPVSSLESVMTTAMSRLNAFLDTELEQILCFDTSIDVEDFCRRKSAIYLVLPEEDSTKHFLVSLILQQLYREMLTVADEKGGQLDKRVMIYADEIGTLPKIEGLEMMFSASRSRKISIVAIIQSLAQFEKTYGKEGAEIIVDNCQCTLFGSFAPNSKTAEAMSKNLGTQTVLSGSISKTVGRDGSNRTLQMIERPLMTVDELKSMRKGHFVVMKTGCYPMKTQLKLFFKWGIKFEEAYAVEEQAERKVLYADRAELEAEVLKKFSQEAEPIEFEDNGEVSKKCAPKTRKRPSNQKKATEK